MQCADARSLLNQGVVPGTADSVRTTLGFHLAQCAACRAFRLQAERQQLLQSLLATPALVPIGPSLAVRPTPAAHPPPRRYRQVSGAVLVASALALVPLGTSAPTRATAQAAPAVQAPAAQPRAAQPQRPAMPSTSSHAILKQAAPAPHRAAPSPVDAGSDLDLPALKRAAYAQALPAPVRAAPAATTDWAMFAPADATDMARSQIIAFEQAGPQQLPAQLLQLSADDTFANVQLQAGQVLFLPEDPPLPPEPPPAVFVPVESLPALPAAPAAPKPQPKPAPKPTKPAQQNARTYAVKSGDTLTAIAARLYGDASRWRSIYEANRNLIGSNPNLIRPNQKLVVPALSGGTTTPSERTYTVRSGDTLSAIALEFYGDGNLWPVLYSANRAVIGGNPDLIFPQQRLSVPGRTQTAPGTAKPPIAKPGVVKATGKLAYTVAKGDSLRGLAKRVYGDESRWSEIYRANRSLIPDPDNLRIGITLTVP